MSVDRIEAGNCPAGGLPDGPRPFNGELGKELIYRTDPRARVWYSSSPSIPYQEDSAKIDPSIITGASLSPNSPEDKLDDSLDKMEMALIREPEDSDRIAVNSVLSAVRYIRLKREEEKGVPFENRSVEPESIDREKALEGFHWIQANIDSAFGEELRHKAIEHRKELNGVSKPHKPANGSTETDNQVHESSRERKTTRRRLQKQVQQREYKERRNKHEADKQAELDLLSSWQEENPFNGTGHFFRAIELFETCYSPSGETIVRPRDGFDEKTYSYARYIAKNPEILELEINDSSSIGKFIEQNNTPILESIYRQVNAASDHAWENSVYIDNPEEFKEVFPKWLSLLQGLSDDYRSNVEFFDPSGIRVHNANANDMRSTEDSIHDRFNTLLQNSLQKTAETHLNDFLDTVHELLHTTLDMEDDFLKDSVLSELHAAHVRSGAINMLLTCTSVAYGVDQEQKLKSADIVHIMEDSGRRETALLNRSNFPKKIKTRYIRDLAEYGARFNIHYNERNGGKKLFGAIMAELMGGIKAGELPDSLYHRLHGQEVEQLDA